MSKSQQHTYKKINTPVWIFFLKNLSSFQIPSIPGICAYMPHDVYECIWRIWQPWATMDFPTTCDDIQPRLIPLSVLDGLSHLHHWVFGVLSCPLLSVCFKLCHLNLITMGNSFWNRNMYVYIYISYICTCIYQYKCILYVYACAYQYSIWNSTFIPQTLWMFQPAFRWTKSILDKLWDENCSMHPQHPRWNTKLAYRPIILQNQKKSVWTPWRPSQGGARGAEPQLTMCLEHLGDMIFTFHVSWHQEGLNLHIGSPIRPG